MSQSSNTLNVSTGPLAEISVLDGSMNTVARAVGDLSSKLTPGLYKVRVRNGPGVEERLVSLDRDVSVDIPPPPIFSPIPLAGTARTDDLDMRRAMAASVEPTHDFGSGSGLFVFCRDWNPSPQPVGANPATGLSLADEDGNILVDLGSLYGRNADDRCVAMCATAAPGSYRLRLKHADGAVSERALFASPRCQTQIFLVLSPERPGSEVRLPDIAGGAVVISPRFSFDGHDRRTELGETARYALTQKRKVLSDQLRSEIVNEKFDDPMLGLLGAHLLLRDEPENDFLFEAVTRNLLRLLGPDHPDLRALCLRRASSLPQVPRSLDTPPMLRASWDIAVAESLQDPSSFPESAKVTKIADKILPTGSWLVWKWDPIVKSATGDAAGTSSALTQSLEIFVAARSRLEAARRANDRGVFGKLSSSAIEAISHSFDRLRGRPAPKPPMPALDAEDREELSRVLGVPGPLLDSTLKKIFD
jgi:hypothetical protein